MKTSFVWIVCKIGKMRHHLLFYLTCWWNLIVWMR